MNEMAAIAVGAMNGAVVYMLGQGQNEGTTAGIVTFAIGMIVGLACVVAWDIWARNRINEDYSSWVKDGRPERRKKERRRRRERA